jgi:predicted esterase YcpF (UPF0227 family)
VFLESGKLHGPLPSKRLRFEPAPAHQFPMTPTHLLYLHGFRSSPQSVKSRHMAQWVRRHAPKLTWWCPQLPPSPQAALHLLMQGVAHWPVDRMAIVGSSLGGFYATVMAEQLGCKAALINPAVDPARDLAHHIGETQAWHSEERFFFEPAFVDELRDMTPTRLARPAQYFAIIATGDEVLDWREMSERYRGSHLRIVEGSNHALTDFDQHLPHLLHFLQLGPSP